MKKRHPGRPPSDEPRERRVVMLLSDREYDALDDEASALTIAPNAAARALLVRALQAAGRLRKR